MKGQESYFSRTTYSYIMRIDNAEREYQARLAPCKSINGLLFARGMVSSCTVVRCQTGFLPTPTERKSTLLNSNLDIATRHECSNKFCWGTGHNMYPLFELLLFMTDAVVAKTTCFSIKWLLNCDRTSQHS